MCFPVGVHVWKCPSCFGETVEEEQGQLWPNREVRENKHWEHGHEQNPAGSGTGVAPQAPLGLWWPSEVTKWSLTLQQLFIKADRLGGDGWGSIHGKEMRPRTVMLYSAKGQFNSQLVPLEWTTCLLLIWLLDVHAVISACKFYQCIPL